MRYAIYVIPGLLFLAVGILFYRALYLNPTYIESPLIGNPAPEFDLPNLTDPSQTVGRKDLLGQVSLVNVWATWCRGCREEHGFLVELADADIVPIYGINWNDERDLALNWLDTLGNPYVASGFDADGSAAIDWGVYGAPETFLVDRDGTVLHKHVAPLTPRIWREDFLPVIMELCGSLPCETDSQARAETARLPESP